MESWDLVQVASEARSPVLSRDPQKGAPILLAYPIGACKPLHQQGAPFHAFMRPVLHVVTPGRRPWSRFLLSQPGKHPDNQEQKVLVTPSHCRSGCRPHPQPLPSPSLSAPRPSLYSARDLHPTSQAAPLRSGSPGTPVPLAWVLSALSRQLFPELHPHFQPGWQEDTEGGDH